MSIDARVVSVVRQPDGSGTLTLADRPARPGGTPGCAGQRHLDFDLSPPEVTQLTGRDVWAGGDGPVMLGDTEIGRRRGYTRVAFHDGDRVRAALAASPVPTTPALPAAD